MKRLIAAAVIAGATFAATPGIANAATTQKAGTPGCIYVTVIDYSLCLPKSIWKP